MTAGCAAPASEEEVGSADGAASANVPLGETELAALLSGTDVTCDATLGEATVCAHDRGIVLLTSQGVALLRKAEGDTIVATALAADRAEAHDVADVLGAAHPTSDLGTATIRPLGWGTPLVRGISELLESLARKVSGFVVTAGAERAEAVAVRSAEGTRAFDDMANQLAGAKVGRTVRGAAVLGGPSFEVVEANARNWLKATRHRTVGIAANHSMEFLSEAEANAFVDGVLLPATRTLGQGERLALVIEHTDFMVTEKIVAILKARHPEVDVVVVTENMYAQARSYGVAFVDLIGTRGQVMVRRLSETVYTFDGQSLVRAN